MACDPKITPAQKAALLKSIEEALGHSAAAQASVDAKLGALLEAQLAKPFGPGSVANIIKDGLQAGASNEEIIGTVKQFYPESKAGKNDIAFYKSKLKKEGKLPGQGGVAPKAPLKIGPVFSVPAPAVSPLKLKKIDIDSLASSLGLKVDGLDAIKDKYALDNILTELHGVEKALNIEDDWAKAETLLKAIADDLAVDDLEVFFDTSHGWAQKITTKKFAELQAKLHGKVSIPLDVLDDVVTAEDIYAQLDLFAKTGDLDALDLVVESNTGVKLVDQGLKNALTEKKKLVNQFDAANPPTTVAEIYQKGLKAGKPESEILEAIQKYQPASKTATDPKAFKNSYAYYKTQLKKAGELPGQKDVALAQQALNAGVKYDAVAAKPLGQLLAVDQVGADTVLGTKVGEATGSNPGGIYLGKDGVKRYVKFYPDATQGYVEHVSNQIYRQLGLQANESGVFDYQGGKVYWSRYREDVKTVGAAKLTPAVANQVLDGFAADVLTANWDVVGMSLDNVGLDAAGNVVRLDNGGSLLFRAKAGRKPADLLTKITEFENFVGKNPSYAKVFDKAGVGGAMDLGERLIKQIDAIQALHQRMGQWSNMLFDLGVKQGLPAADAKAIVDMLEARSALLYKKREEIRAWIQTSAQRAANRAVAEREIVARAKASYAYTEVEQRLAAVARQHLDKLAAADASYLPELRAAASTSHGYAEKKALDLRYALLKEQMRDKFTSEAAYQGFLEKYDAQVREWFGSSSSQGAGAMKLALQELYPEMRTAYHGRFIKGDAAAALRAGLNPWVQTNWDLFKQFIYAEKNATKVYLRELYGKETVTLKRGVHTSYFADAGMKIPTPGEHWVDVGNPVASWSAKKLGFGSLSMTAEVPIDDIWSVYHLQPGGRSYWQEREFLVMGRPLLVTRAK